MHAVQLSAVDLNLLPLLHALLEEQNVTAAGRRVGRSPSAASHALARLRDLFDDPLLVRSGRRLTRTPRADALRPLVARLVDSFDGLMRPMRAVDPTTLLRSFRLLASDDVRLVLLRVLDVALAAEAPGVDLYTMPLGPGSLERLRAGEADASVAVYDRVPEEFSRQPLFRDVLVPCARTGHPATARPLSAAEFATFTHILVAPLGSPRGLVDDALAALGLTRRVARTTPAFHEAADLANQGDHVVTLPGRFLAALGERGGLVQLDVALEFPSFQHSLVWHGRLDADPEHRWWRDVVRRVATDLPP